MRSVKRGNLFVAAAGVAALGAVVLVSQPFGPPPGDGEPLSRGAWLSGLLLAWSPTLALFAWFRESTHGEREPLGSSTSRKIGRFGGSAGDNGAAGAGGVASNSVNATC